VAYVYMDLFERMFRLFVYFRDLVLKIFVYDRLSC
jgi:hypothetical protein